MRHTPSARNPASPDGGPTSELAPRHATEPAGSDHLCVGVAGSTFTVSVDEALLVAVTPRLSPLPLASAPVEGMAEVNGSPVVQVDVALALSGRPGAGRTSVVVRHEAGPVACRVETVSTGGAPGTGRPGPPSLLAWLSPLLPPFVARPREARPARPAGPVARPLPLFLVRSRGKVLAVPAASIERVDRFEEQAQAPPWTLVRLNEEVLPARPLPSRLDAGSAEQVPSWGLVVRPDGERLVWTVESVIGVRDAARDAIHAIRLPGEPPLLWYEPVEGAFVEIVDPEGSLEGHGAPSRRPFESAWKFQGDLRLRCGPYRCLLPLGMIRTVLTGLEDLPPRARAADDLPVLDAARLLGHTGQTRPRHGVVVDFGAGRPAVLAAHDVRAASIDLGGELHPLPAVPAAVAELLDAVILDEGSGDWTYRLRRPAPGSPATSGPLFESALMGWLAPL